MYIKSILFSRVLLLHNAFSSVVCNRICFLFQSLDHVFQRPQHRNGVSPPPPTTTCFYDKTQPPSLSIHPYVLPPEESREKMMNKSHNIIFFSVTIKPYFRFFCLSLFFLMISLIKYTFQLQCV